MENKLFVKYILIIVMLVVLFGTGLFFINYIFNKKIEIVENKISTLQYQKPTSCMVRQAKYPFPYGDENGESTQNAQINCLDNEHLVTGGCEIISSDGSYGDFGGQENIGYLVNRPNDNGNGWLCGYFGGQKSSYDSKSFIDKGIWNLNVYVYCCE